MFVGRSCRLIDEYFVQRHVLITIQFKKLKRNVKNFSLIQLTVVPVVDFLFRKQLGKDIVVSIAGQLSRLNVEMLNVSFYPPKPKERKAKRFEATWCSPVFGERIVTEAKFTRADSKERVEMQSAVEEYLKNGGKITKYGDQPAKIEVEGDIKWQIDRTEERDIQNELSRIWGVGDVLGN